MTQTTGKAEGGGAQTGPISPLTVWMLSAALTGQISASVLNAVNGMSRWQVVAGVI